MEIIKENKNIEIYTIVYHFFDELEQGKTFQNVSKVSVGFHPNREFGDNEESWTDSQKEFDEGIAFYFENIDDFNNYKDKKNTRNEFYISSFKLDETINLEDI